MLSIPFIYYKAPQTNMVAIHLTLIFNESQHMLQTEYLPINCCHSLHFDFQPIRRYGKDATTIMIGCCHSLWFSTNRKPGYKPHLPIMNCIKGFLVCDIIHKYKAHSTSVVSCCYCSVPLLARCVLQNTTGHGTVWWWRCTRTINVYGWGEYGYLITWKLWY